MTKQEKNNSQDTEEISEEMLEEHPILQVDEEDKEDENLPIGKLLRQTREKKALTIYDISEETNISSSNLTSVELGNYDALPADTFIRGQIVIYANFLGLDGKEAARLFFEERAQCLTEHKGGQFSRKKRGLSTKELAEPTHISSATWAISLLALIIIFLSFFSWYTGWNPFASFFKNNPAHIGIALAVAQSDNPEFMAEYEQFIFPRAEIPEQAAKPSDRQSTTKTVQTIQEAKNETAEQNTITE